MLKLNYRFRYAGDKAGDVPTKIDRCLLAYDDAHAFRQKDEYLASIKGEYSPGTMQVYQSPKWQPIADPMVLVRLAPVTELAAPMPRPDEQAFQMAHAV